MIRHGPLRWPAELLVTSLAAVPAFALARWQYASARLVVSRSLSSRGYPVRRWQCLSSLWRISGHPHLALRTAMFGQERPLPRGIALLNSGASRLQNRLEPVTSPGFLASAGSVYTVHA